MDNSKIETNLVKHFLHHPQNLFLEVPDLSLTYKANLAKLGMVIWQDSTSIHQSCILQCLNHQALLFMEYQPSYFVFLPFSHEINSLLYALHPVLECLIPLADTFPHTPVLLTQQFFEALHSKCLSARNPKES